MYMLKWQKEKPLQARTNSYKKEFLEDPIISSSTGNLGGLGFAGLKVQNSFLSKDNRLFKVS